MTFKPLDNDSTADLNNRTKGQQLSDSALSTNNSDNADTQKVELPTSHSSLISDPVKNGSVPAINPDNRLAEIHIDKLPSKFIPYNGNELFVTSYSYGEIKQLGEANLPVHRKYQIMAKSIRSTFSPFDLTLFDFYYIMFLRKVSNLNSSIYEVNKKCTNPKCLHNNKFQINAIEDIGFQELEIESLPISVDFNTIGKDVEISPFTIGDFIKLNSMKRFYETDENGEYIEGIDRGYVKDSISIMAIQMRNLEFNNAYDLIKNCVDDEDITLLEHIDSIFYHDVSNIIRKCSNCGTTIEIGLTGGGPIILPFRGDEVSIRARIKFGNKASS